MIDHTRHMGIFNADTLDVCLIGAGGIGAITAITLGKMGVHKIHLYDDDIVDEINLATQFHRISDVGYRKVRTVHNSIWEFSQTHTSLNGYRVNKDTQLPVTDIYISTVDSIASRQEIWKAVQKSNRSALKPWYLDARMGAEVFELFVVNLQDYAWYSNTVNNANDDDIPDLPCTSKATIYTANIAAGHIGAAVRRIVTRKQQPGFLHHDILHNELSFLEMGE
jgi:molybdopterin/thiamine biosynthesis adenylyltransferase